MTLAGLVALTLAAGAVTLDSSSGIRVLTALNGELEKAQAELGQLQQEREALSREVRALEDDPFEIERRAREDQGMIFPGERVLRCCE